MDIRTILSNLAVIAFAGAAGAVVFAAAAWRRVAVATQAAK